VTPGALREALKPAARGKRRGCFLRTPPRAPVRVDSHDPVRLFNQTRIGDPPLSGKLCNLRAIRGIQKNAGIRTILPEQMRPHAHRRVNCSVYLHKF
jgi:hypothetical protein